MDVFKKKIPASSANLGLGFDSIGVAVDLFLTIETQISNAFTVEYKNEALEVLEKDEDNENLNEENKN